MRCMAGGLISTSRQQWNQAYLDHDQDFGPRAIAARLSLNDSAANHSLQILNICTHQALRR